MPKTLRNADWMGFQSYFVRQSDFSESAFATLIDHTNEVAVLQILARFRNTLTDTISIVRTGLHDNDKQNIWRICHKVAGIADLLGFERLGKVSREFSHDFQFQADNTIDAHHRSRLVRYLEDCESLFREFNESCPNLSRYL